MKRIKSISLYLYLFFIILTVSVVAANALVDPNKNQQLNIEKAPNGVPIININAPNKNGLSHNYFKEYNVEKNGVLLNNSREETVRTQLGGLIQGNNNFKNRQEASAILTEVTGINRSRIEGHIEVAGRSADYILANPNGVYLNGAGFINTPRVTLTTGRSMADNIGNLKGFDIDDGTIVIGSQGVDGKNVRMIDIISRTAELNGAIYGGDQVNVILGRNEYNQKTGEVERKSEKSKDKPKLALDGKALGSLYAGRIYIRSTEKDLGVNSQGTMLAGTGDLTINIHGDLVLKDTQAKENIDIKAKNTTFTEKVIAENNIDIKTGNISNTGNLSSNNSTNINSDNIKNNGVIEATRVKLTNKNKVLNQGNIIGENIEISSAHIDNTNMSGENINLNISNSLLNRGDISGAQNLNITGGTLSNLGDIKSKNTNIVNNKVENSGNVLGTEKLLLNSDIANKQTGDIAGKETVISGNILNNGKITGINTIIIAENVDNSGTIAGKDKLLITSSIKNNGEMFSEDRLSISGETFHNEGKIKGNQIEIDTDETLNLGEISSENNLKIKSKTINKITGEIASQEVEILGDILNDGSILGTNTLITAKNTENNGIIAGRDNLTITSSVKNSGEIFSENRLSISGETLHNEGKIKGKHIEILGETLNDGSILGTNTLITAKNTENSGIIAGKDKLTITSSTKNSGELFSENQLSISGETLHNISNIIGNQIVIDANETLNTGRISGENNLKIKSKTMNKITGEIASQEVEILGDILNDGKIIGTNTIITAKDIESSGIIAGKNKLMITSSIKNSGKMLNEIILNIFGDKLENNGEIIGSNVNIKNNEIANFGTIYGEKSLLAESEIVNENTGIVAGEVLNIIGKTLNKGSILGNTAIITAEEINNSGTITGEETLTISAMINNTGDIQGKKLLDITGNITNNKNIKSDNNLNIIGKLSNDGYIYGSKTSIDGSVFNSGKILALEDMEILGNISNNKTISSGNKMHLESNNLENVDTISGKNLKITSAHLNNIGGITGEETNLNIVNIENTGIIYGEETVNISGDKLTNSKLIQSNKDIEINSKDIVNNGDLFAGNNMKISTLKLSNQGRVIGDENLSVITSEVLVNTNLIQGENVSLNKVSNSGKIVSTDSFMASEVENRGTISALKDILMDKIHNLLSGKIISGKKINTAAELRNEGIVSAKGGITAENVTNTGSILSDIDITLKNLDNSRGSIEGSNIRVINSGGLNNQSGKIKTFNDNSILSLEGNNIDNSGGEIHSQGTLDLNMDGLLTLEGSYIGNKLLKITTDSLISNTDIENGGDLELYLKGNFLNNNKFASNKNMTIKGKNFINNNVIGSRGSFNTVLSGDFNNFGNIVLGSENNNLTVSQNLVNDGFLTSQNNLTINTGDLVNKGQIASVKNILFNSNNISNTENSLIFSNEIMEINTLKNFSNNKGEVYSGSDLTIDANGDVKNIMGTLESKGDLNIIGNQIENLGEVTGDHSVVGKVPGSSTTVDVTKIDKSSLNRKSERIMAELYNSYIQSGRWTWFSTSDRGVYLKYIDEIKSNYTSTLAYISSEKNITLKANNDIINREGNVLANEDISIEANKLINEKFSKEVEIGSEWRRNYELHGSAMYTLDHNSYYLGGKVLNSNRDKGEVIIKDTVIQKIGSDKESKISAGNNIFITANKVGNGVLSNDSNSVVDKNINVDHVILNNTNISKTGTVDTENYITIPKGDKGLFVVNSDLIENTDVDLKNNSNINYSNDHSKNDFGNNPDIDYSKINSNISVDILETSGVFRKNNKNFIGETKTPKFSYLIETNVKFIDMDHYLGSDYFFGKIKYNPEENARLLGDSFYETRIVNRAILENTGARYLNGTINEKEQMKMLFDNSIDAMKDMGLSVGIALTKKQINNLKGDIIWYVEKEVNGVSVLVPEVYLSKETLASLGDNQTGLTARNNMKISALQVDNTGIINSEKDLVINTDELLNRSVLGDSRALISGNNIKITSINDIRNMGAEISAGNNISLDSLKGNIWNQSTQRENNNVYGKSKRTFENLAEIKAGNNITASAKKNFLNTGASVDAGKDLSVSGNKITIENVEDYFYDRSGGDKNYTIREKVRNSGSLVNGDNISLSAKKDIDVKGSDIGAKKDLSVSAGGNVNIAATVDSDYYEKQKTRKKSWGRSKVTKDIKYNENINESNLVAGDNLKIKSGNNVNVVGSDLSTGNNLSINAENNVNIISARKGSSDYHTSQKTGFLGLSGTSRKEVEVNYTNIASNIKTTGDMEIVSKKGDVRVLASNLESKKDINIGAGNNVNILAADDITKKQKQKTKYGVKYFASADNWNFQVGSKTGIEKNKKANYDTKVKGSNLLSDGDINIIGNKNVTVEASNLFGNDNNIYASNELNITGRKEVHKETTKNEKIEMTTRVGLDLSGINNTITSIKNAVTGIKDLPEVINMMTTLISGKDLNESLEGNEDGLNALNNMLNGPSDGGVSGGIYVGAEFSTDKNTRENTNKVVSRITSQNNVNLKTDQGDMNFEGTKVNAGNNINIDSGKNININSAVNTGKGKSSSFDINGEYNVLTGQISGGIDGSKGSNSDKIHTNTEFRTGNKADISGENLMIKGGNIVGNEVNIDVKNLVVESVQDKSSSKNIGLNLNGSSGGKNSSGSGGAGLNYSNYDKEWVENQSTIIGVKNSEITVAENTNLAGGLLGGGNTTLDTGTLTYSNIRDKEKGIDIGISGTISENKKAGSTGNKKSVEGSYGAIDREQITNATIGHGTIIVGGKEENPNINRDESKGQEITKDININTITAKYSSDSREWDEVQDIMGEHGKSIGKDLDAMTGNKYNLEGKVEKGFKNTYVYVEDTIDEKLGGKFVGIVPTYGTNGGYITQLGELYKGGERIRVQTYESIRDENGKIVMENGEIKTETVIKEVSVDEYKEMIGNNEIDMENGEAAINGVGNSPTDTAQGTAHLTLKPEDTEALLTGKTITKLSIYNPSHGVLSDGIESAVGIVGRTLNSDFNVKDLKEIILADPRILNNMVAHSQGTIKLEQALNSLTKDNNDILKGKSITFAGSPVFGKRQDELEGKVKSVGGEFNSMRNEGDGVVWLSGEKPNVEKAKGATGHGTPNYNMNAERKKADSKFTRNSGLMIEKRDENGNVIIGEDGKPKLIAITLKVDDTRVIEQGGDE